MKIIFLPEADEEFREAARYYESEAAGVGIDFIAAVHTALDKVVEFPLTAQVLRAGIRRKVLQLFRTIFSTLLKLIPSSSSRWHIKESDRIIGADV